MATATRLTAQGFEMLGAAIAGGQLTFTKARIGNSLKNGAIYQPTTQEQFALTDLISPQLTLPIHSVTNNGQGNATVTFRVVNENLSAGIAMREIGVYATCGTAPERLYCYWHSADSYEFLHPPEVMLIDMFYSVVTVIAEAEHVTAIFAPDTTQETLRLTREQFLSAVF